MSNQQKKIEPSEGIITSSAYKSRTDPPRYLAEAHLDGKEMEQTILHEGIVYDRTDRIEFDLDSIPKHVRDSLSEFIISAAKEYYAQPGAEEGYQEWLENRRKTSKR